MKDIYSETEVYHTLEVVGEGTFGKVAKCWRGSDGELVAIKTMQIDPHRNRVIQNELKLVASLSRSNLTNSNIIEFYETFRDQTHHYLVFELLEKNLYQLQKENGFRPMAVRNIRTITCQMLKALAKLKELGIIHADLKPENVMIVDQGTYPFHVKLIDFGSASIFSEVRYVKEPYIQSRFYRSPEILLGLPFCEKVDMWSLGCVMCELFLGWPLYPGETEQEQIRYICETQGQPRDNLLSAASKADHFFVLQWNSRGQGLWQLKPSKKRRFSGPGRRGGGGGGGAGRGGSERRKYIISSLDQLATLELGSRAEGQEEEACREDAAAEMADRRSMVELLKRMLTLDSHTRIQPTAALKHPFITLSHMGSSPACGRYRAASRLAYEHARVLEEGAAVDNDAAGPRPPRAEGCERSLFQREAKTRRPRPEGRRYAVDREQGPDGHRGDDSVDYNSQRAPFAPSRTQTPTEVIDELCLDDISLEPSTAAWAISSVSTSSSSLSVGLQVQPGQSAHRAPGLDGPLQIPALDCPALGSANGEDGRSAVPNVFAGLCESRRLRQLHVSRSDPTHGPNRASGPRAEADPGPARGTGGSSDQATRAGQSACHHGEQVQFVQYGRTEGPPCHCDQWSPLPGWTSDPEIAQNLTRGSRAPACGHGSQHCYLPY